MANKLNDARRSLDKAKQSAQARLAQIDEERRELLASIKSLESAERALAKSKSSSAKRLAALTTDEVIRFLQRCLQDGRHRTMSDLHAQISKIASEQKRSKVGLKMRLKQALSDQRFVRTGSEYQMRHDAPKKTELENG